MGFDDGRIVFNSDTGIYYSGQTVFGKLIFDQGKHKTFRGIYVKIKGFCKVHWRTSHTRSVNGKQETYHEDHTAEEEYLNYKTYLIGSEHGEQSIPPGHYEYPFQCPIPPTCPSSFEGTHGHIRYEVKAVVDRAFKTDQEKKAVIRVISPIDLNTEPGAKDPVQMRFDETYYCCCARSGRVVAVVKLPHAGFVPGQGIPVEVGCENTGSVTIDSVTIKLKKDTKFHAQGSTRSESEEVGEIELGGVAAGTTGALGGQLTVPHVDTPNVRACRHIDVDYRLKVTISPDGCHSDSSQSRKIVIGTIPIVGSSYPQSVHDQIAQQKAAVVNQPAPSPYPGGTVYPGATVYPGVTPYPTSPYPGQTSPYPNASYPGANPPPQYPPPYSDIPAGNAPYPNPAPAPYPNEKAPYPGGPNINPYPTSNSPYPTSNSPYPTSNSPYPTSNSPYPTPNSPYPRSNSPQPPTSFGTMAYPPGPHAPTGLRTGTFGFVGQAGDGNAAVPQLPPGAAIPYPTGPGANPYAAASAPQPTSPQEEEKKPMLQ